MKLQQHSRQGGSRGLRLPVLAATLLALAACEEGATGLNFLKPQDKGGEETASLDSRSVKLIERDIEAPEVFQVTEAGLWDGRPSLGGVWVAHPETKDPERVIIRNTTNGKFVIGALFRRERETPGPRLQVSSDAASALGLLAGKPVNLNVTALRREEVEGAPAGTPQAGGATGELSAPSEIAEATLAPAGATGEVSGDTEVAATAAAAIDAAGTPNKAAEGTDGDVVLAGTIARPKPAAPQAAARPKPEPAAAAATPKRSTLDKPYLQIGIFSVEQNANNTAESMRQAGMVPTVRRQASQGKTFWRVVVGPASSTGERDALLKKIKGTGFTDAYAVTD